MELWAWHELATFNSEVARGVMHTEEWKEKMRIKQEEYNEWIASS